MEVAPAGSFANAHGIPASHAEYAFAAVMLGALISPFASGVPHDFEPVISHGTLACKHSDELCFSCMFMSCCMHFHT